MKKTLTTAIAALMLVAPLAIPAASADQYGQGPPQGQHQGQQQGDAHQNNPSGYRDSRHHWRDQRADARWDESVHNGYYDNNRWHYGPPPSDRYGQRGFALGYQPWARGQRLGYYANRYQEVNYRDHHLRRPPHGYHWVQDDRGDYLLAAIATGIILQVMLSSGR